MTTYKVAKTNLIVTKPDGSMVKKEAILYSDQKNGSIGIKFTDGMVAGYCFDLMNSEIERVKSSGIEMPALP